MMVEERFQELQQQIQQFYNNNFNYMLYPGPGDVVVAKTTDGIWCRAKVLQVQQDQVKVFCVDYGATEWVHALRIRTMQHQFVRFEVDTFKCKLHGLGYRNPLQATKFFEKMVKSLRQPYFRCYVVSAEESGVHQVVLYTMDGEFVSANEVMVESGNAFTTTSNVQQVHSMLQAEFNQVHQTNKKQIKYKLGELLLDYCRVRPEFMVCIRKSTYVKCSVEQCDDPWSIYVRNIETDKIRKCRIGALCPVGATNVWGHETVRFMADTLHKSIVHVEFESKESEEVKIWLSFDTEYVSYADLLVYNGLALNLTRFPAQLMAKIANKVGLEER